MKCKIGFLQKAAFKRTIIFKKMRGVGVITTAELHSTKPEFRFCAGSNSACGVSEIRDGEDLC